MIVEDNVMNLDDKSSLILIATNNSKSAFEVSRECNLPLSTTYRKLDALLRHRLVKISGEITNGKRHLLFTNNTKNNHFKNPQRALLIMSAIAKNPGISFREIQRISDLANGVVSHYLSQLQKKGFLQVKRKKRKIWLFTSDTPDEEMNLIINLRKETSHAIVLHLLEVKSATFYDLTRHIGKCPASISIGLSRLVHDGLVIKTRNTHNTYLLKDPKLISKTLAKLCRQI